MLKVLVIFSESLSMQIWLHIGFRKYIEQSKGKVLFCALYVLYYYVASIFEIKTIIDVIPILLIIIWVKKQLVEKLGSTIIKLFISIVGLGMTQLISIWFLSIIDNIINIVDEEIYIGGNIISLIISTLIYCFFLKVRLKSIKFNLYFVSILVYIMWLLIYIKYDFHKNVGLYGDLYVVLISILILFGVVALKGLKTHYRLEQKQLELEMKEKYEEVYNLLLLEMRRKQHDYKNQIAALYSIQLVNGKKDELIMLQREYGDKLLESGKYDNLILECSNPVLSGYIYTKCNEAERQGVSIEPNIKCTKTNYRIAIHQIVEMLGILIDNAVEYLVDKDWENKAVKIKVFERLDRLHIEVSNVTEYISYEKIEEMFTMGYSTKGQDRGVGLYSLKSIVEKNKGELLVENVEDMSVNWFMIKVII